MNILKKIKVKGEVSLTATDKDGNVRTYSQPNLVTTEGIGYFASKIFDKENTLYTSIGNAIPAQTDTVKYFISEIEIGDDDTAAQVTDTMANRPSTDDRISLRKNITISALEETTGEFYFSAEFRAIQEDTLQSGGSNSIPIPIKEMLLLAKGGVDPITGLAPTYNSPGGSLPDDRKIICRTVLEQPFTKYFTDRITATWKIKIG